MERKTILLVEDEVIQAMMGKSALEKYGYSVLTAISGEKAVTAVEAIPEIDLILMDIDLGTGIDGTEAAQLILARHDIPVVFLSSHMEQEIVAKTEKITSYGYVVKNSPITVLDASIKMAFKLFEAKLNERRKEQTLQQASKKYEILFTSMTEGFAVHEIICDERGKPVDYRFLDMNPAFEHLTGLEARNILGKTVLSVMPDTEKIWIERYGHVALTGEILRFEDYSRVLDRYFQVISFSPERNKFAVLFSDITERKLVELRLQAKNEEYEALNEELQVQNEELRLADQTLRESEERFKALHNASFGGIAIHDRGMILECNQGLSEMSGFAYDELIGMDGLLLIAPESRALVRNNIAQGCEKAYEAVGIRKNGDLYPVRLEARNVPYKGRQVRTVEFRDITEQRQIEKALRESEEHYKALFRKNHAVMLLIDPASAIIVDANAAACEYYGYTLDELKGMLISKINTMPPKKIAEELQQAVQNKNNSFQFRHRLANGEVRDVEVFSGPLTVNSNELLYSMVFDTTDRVETEKTLQIKNKYLETILQTTPDGFWVVNAQKRLVEANDAYCRMSGYSRDELLRLQINDIEAFEDPAETERHMQQILRTGSDLFETKHRRKDGTLFDIEMSTTLIDKDGGLLVCFCRDISGRKEAESRIRTLLDEKELLLKEVHHRVKNNMNTINALLTLQAGSADTGQTAAPALLEAGSRVKTMQLLYDKLYKSTSFTELSTAEYLPALVDEIMYNLPNTDTIRVEKNIGDILLDARQLQPLGIILYELLTNVMKHSFVGRNTGKITVSAALDGTLVRVAVEDDGIGIPKSVHLENSTGFGLVLVRGLSQQLGGSIRIEREKGTRIVLEFEK